MANDSFIKFCPAGNAGWFETSETYFNIKDLPDDLLLGIFSFLSERDLCRLAQVCRRFSPIADDPGLWKRLFRLIYEYDLPLMVGPNPGEFYFVETSEEHPNSLSKSTAKPLRNSLGVFPGMRIERQVLETRTDEAPPSSSSTSGAVPVVTNLWKASFGQLYRALHVNPEYDPEALEKKQAGQAIQHFWCIEAALEWYEELNPDLDFVPLILVHPGTYADVEFDLSYPIMMLGCGPGRNPAENVVIRQLDPDPGFDNCFIFREGSGRSYLGYLTFVSGDKSNAFYRHVCIDIRDDAKPIIDHCQIKSLTRYGTAIAVKGNSEPTVQYCDISDCECTAIWLTDKAGGLFKENRILRNTVGMWLGRYPCPVFSRNTIQECVIGIGRFYYENNSGYLLLEDLTELSEIPEE